MPNAPSTTTTAPSARADEDVTTTLYRAVIGPVNQAYYLPIWTRFESAGRAGLTWNSAAALLTLNWLIFRKLWLAALAYAGGVLGLGLSLFGIGGLVFQYTDTAQMGLVVGFGLALVILPGLFGNVLFYADCRKKMARALAAHAQLPNACADLHKQASTRVRIMVIAAANAIVAGLLAFSFIGFSTMKSPAAAAPSEPERGNAVSGRALDLSQTPIAPALMATSAATPMATPIATPASAPIAAQAPAAQASSPVSSPVSSPASAPASAPSPIPLSAPLMALAASQPAPVVAPKPETGKESPPIRATAKPVKPAPQALAKPPAQTKPLPKPPARPQPKAATPSVHPIATPLAARAKPVEDVPEQAAEVPLYYVNAGLFSNPENAARVHSKLIEARLPSVMKALQTSKERQIRVRVGPFTSHQQAEQAAASMRALQLEASIVQR